MVVTDHYETLGVAYNASLKDINSAYKRLALKHHPDKAGGSDIDDFQKIQQAAETLRDPIRRRRHDHELRVHRVKRQQAPASGNGSGSGSGFYSRWMPSSVGSYSMGTSGYRYMYSYGNSVHMNPDSKDSVDERERIARERKLDEEIRQRKSYHHHRGSSSSNQEEEEDVERTAPKYGEKSRERSEDKSWEMRRQEAMKARVVRDEEELDDEGGKGESIHGKGEHVKQQEGDGHPEVFEEEKSHHEKSDEKDGSTNSMYDENEQESEDGGENEDDSIILSDAQSASEYGTAQESEASDSFAEDDGPGTEEEDITVFYDCKQSHIPNNNDTAASQNEPSSESNSSEEDEEEEEEDDDDEEEGYQQKNNNTNNINEGPSSLLSPFIPYLMTKLNDPSGNYTKEDLHVELHGIIMETYCGWLENLRLSFPNTKSQQHTTSAGENEQQQICLHLGYWEKTFGCPECEVCHRWKPIYTLTCRGCGIKACVGCKFQGKDMV